MYREQSSILECQGEGRGKLVDEVQFGFTKPAEELTVAEADHPHHFVADRERCMNPLRRALPGGCDRSPHARRGDYSSLSGAQGRELPSDRADNQRSARRFLRSQGEPNRPRLPSGDREQGAAAAESARGFGHGALQDLVEVE